MTVAANSESIIAIRICLNGCVQGSGVRPTVARLARSLELAGSARNTLAGLEIEVEGPAARLEQFQELLVSSFSSGTTVEQIKAVGLTPTQRSEFTIERDTATGPLTTRIPPDVVVCEECLAEVNDPNDRRHSYPLTTCSTCGPRYSLIQNMPFDRDQTTMNGFTLCEDCRSEYESPSDRRYHAQTIACSACGPQVWLVDSNGERQATGTAAIATAAHSILGGKIVALRGVGGYQLLCDATNCDVVERLRRRKGRPAKPFAVLVASLTEAQRLAFVDDEESRALTDKSNPIVLLLVRASDIAAAVYPGLNKLGLMLPSTPLHAMLSEKAGRPLVCTSANREGEPLEFDVPASEANLAGIADLWLHHDRPIARPVDDSVLQVIAGRRVTLRLGRGLAPLPLDLPAAKPQLAVGGHMKSAIAWHNGSQAALGSHLGDLDTVGTRERFSRHITDMSALYRFEPEAVTHDLHPDYFSTRDCSERDIKTLGVQHHFAHVAGGMLEHGLLDCEVLGVSWDGTGFGEDGSMWGGEFLVVGGSGWLTSCSPVPEARHSVCRWRKPPDWEPSKNQKPEGLTQRDCVDPPGLGIPNASQPVVYTTGKGYADPSGLKFATSEDVSKGTSSNPSLTLRVTKKYDPETMKSPIANIENQHRVAHLRAFPVIGGEMAIRQPWRVAASLLNESHSDDTWVDQAKPIWSDRPIGALLQLYRETTSPMLSTSVGRLFDAAAAIILGIDAVHYEGQAAMMLESAAASDSSAGYSLPLAARQLDWREMIRAIWEDRFAGVNPAVMSARFHRALAGGIVAVAAQFPELPIVLAGGVFQNKLLTELVVEMMGDDRERLKLPGKIPPNDGGLAAGQLAIAIMRERASQRDLQTMEQ